MLQWPQHMHKTIEWDIVRYLRLPRAHLSLWTVASFGGTLEPFVETPVFARENDAPLQCDGTHSYVRHDLFVRAMWLHSLVYANKICRPATQRDSFVCATRLIRSCPVLWRDAFSCATCFIHVTYLLSFCAKKKWRYVCVCVYVCVHIHE